MRIRLAAGLVALALSGAAPTASAHHGWNSYDAGTTVMLQGKVKRLAWGSPHGTIWLDHAGKEVEVVLAPVSRMETRGLAREMIVEGSTVSLDAYRHREKDTEYRAERIRVGDKSVELR